MCKTCTKCSVTYEIVEDNFFKRLNSFTSRCKVCLSLQKKEMYKSSPKENKYNKEYYQKNKESILLSLKKWKNKNENRVRDSNKKVLNKKVNDLNDSYVRRLIKISKTNYIKNPTPEYIEAYRQVILLKREQKQLNNLIKTLENGSSNN